MMAASRYDSKWSSLGAVRDGVVAPVVIPEVPSGIHLWRVWLDPIQSDLERLSSWLSSDEHARIQRYRFLRDRARFVAGRGVLRWLVGQSLNRDPASLEFVSGPMGKPRLASGVAGSMHFNLSHSDGLAIYALSADHELGVDVERIRPVSEAEAILRNHFPPEVIVQWRAIPAQQQPAAFFQSWVRREAIAKREGCGLVGLEESPELLAAPGSVIQFVPASGYVGALAWRGPENPG